MNFKRMLACAAMIAATAVSFAKEAENAKPFFTLPVCRRADGVAEVLKPGTHAWVKIEEGKFYPLGSSFRTAKGGSLKLNFGKESSVTIADGGSFATKVQPLGTPSRTIVLTGGEVTVKLPVAMKAGMFSVTTAGFTAKDLAGESLYGYTVMSDGFDATVRCVTGTISVSGRHFEIPTMRAADAFRIRSSHDDLETVLYGTSGDYVMTLDRGLLAKQDIDDDGQPKLVTTEEKLDWHLSVSTRVQINRAVPSIGERLSVTVMTFDSAGTMRNNYAFAEGRAEVNTGELVRKTGDASAGNKRAAEATVDGDADVEDDSVEESEESESEASDDGDGEGEDASSDDGDSSDSDDDEDDDF